MSCTRHSFFEHWFDHFNLRSMLRLSLSRDYEKDEYRKCVWKPELGATLSFEISSTFSEIEEWHRYYICNIYKGHATNSSEKIRNIPLAPNWCDILVAVFAVCQYMNWSNHTIYKRFSISWGETQQQIPHCLHWYGEHAPNHLDRLLFC